MTLLICMILPINSWSQIECSTPGIQGDPNLIYNNSSCNNLPSYFPLTGFSRTVKLNFIVIQDENGANNFDHNNVHYLTDWFYKLNERFGLNGIPSDPMPGINDLNEIGVNFVLEGITFVQSSTYNDFKVPDYLSIPDVIQDINTQFGVNVFSTLNIFFTEDSDINENTYHGFANILNSIPFPFNYDQYGVVMQNTYSNQFPGNNDYTMLLAHEIGHIFGLIHPYDVNHNQPNTFCDPIVLADPFPDTWCPDAGNGWRGWCDPDEAGTTFDGCTNNLMAGSRRKEYLSPMQIGTIHKTLAERGYFSTLCDYQQNESLQISTPQVWEYTKMIDRDIIIINGGSLTVKCQISMPTGARIIVETGGQLIIDGGTITSLCGNYWNGIEVRGNSSLSQLPLNNQGYVKIINGGKIEYAKCGIETQKRDNNGAIVPGCTGGIIQANNASFINNIASIRIWPYEYTGSKNLCKFTNCIFSNKIDLMDYIDPSIYTENMMDLSGVVGIEVEGCTFENTSIFKSDFPYNKRGTGIKIFNSSVFVKGLCLDNNIPCETIKRNKFRRLNYGIYADYTNPLRSLTIDTSLFENNYNGIYISGNESAIVTRNSFIVGNYKSISSSMPQRTYGLYLDNSSGYSIEQNDFNYCTYVETAIPQIGLIVNNSGIEDNIVYNNKFNHLDYGLLAQERNRNSNGNTGLTIKCNDFTICSYDISITQSYEGSDYGIKKTQGSGGSLVTDPANNTFSDSLFIKSNYTNINAEIFYWYNKNNNGAFLKPLKYSEDLINLQNNDNMQYFFSKYEACPLHIINQGGYENLRYNLVESKAKIDSTFNILNNSIDGGNTASLNTAVILTTPPMGYQTYEELSNVSPFLSDKVMISSINNEYAITPPLITSILCLNPHSAKSDSVQDALDLRSTPLTEQQRQLIDQGWFTNSPKERLESSLAAYYSLHTGILNKLIRIYHDDTSNFSVSDSIIALLNNEPGNKVKYSKAYEYLKQNDSTLAFTELNKIDLTSLPINELGYHVQTEAYFNLLLHFLANSGSIYTCDTSNLEDILELNNNSMELIQTYTRNLLKKVVEVSYIEPVIFPNNNAKSVKSKKDHIKEISKNNDLKAYPNPAIDYFSIEYRLCETSNEISIFEIKDMKGNLLLEVPLKDLAGMLLFSTTDLANGIYLCYIRNNNTILNSCKLTVVK